MAARLKDRITNTDKKTYNVGKSVVNISDVGAQSFADVYRPEYLSIITL